MNINRIVATMVLPAGLAMSLEAQTSPSNTNAIPWSNNPVSTLLETTYNRTGAPLQVLDVQMTVSPGYELDLNSLSMYLDNAGVGSGNEPSPYFAVYDSGNSLLATSEATTFTTAKHGIGSITSQADAAPYYETFTFSTPLSLGPGTYDFDLWDTGEQLIFMNAGVFNDPGLAVAGGTFANSVQTPAMAINGEVVVPEPGTLALAGLGALGFMIARRHRPLGQR